MGADNQLNLSKLQQAVVDHFKRHHYKWIIIANIREEDTVLGGYTTLDEANDAFNKARVNHSRVFMVDIRPSVGSDTSTIQFKRTAKPKGAG